ncbi:alpha-galactosidase [Streptococcus cuniculi]|uniref:Alpha-galactosidase n=2 Tax=Streptococcus cuniculi TaxID=1432788 RepID=A0A4Y9J749_9STRE|nr:alpha-galactosidase [Streptococcus cuniculi]MBF0779178.1 alpha-galactosidase [Streptococcus cuniculi]TFU96853.1 alpha-galactosidase [Streptococcus cuniculi]
MQVLDNQQLVHRYFGKKVNRFSSSNKMTYLDRAFAPSPISGNRTFSLDALPLEYSSNGLGDFRSASIEVRNDFGVGLDLKYRAHRISKGKPALEGLPSSFATDDEVETLEIDLYDALTDITLTLFYSVFEEANFLARSAKITTGEHATKIEGCLSFTLDMPRKDFVVHSLMGRYGYEKEWTRTPLTSGRYEIGSVRGASGHSQTPFIALADEAITEDSGEIYTAHLVYSGNFKAFAETSPLHHTRWGIGLNDQAFSWQLEAHQSFQTPEALLSYTDQGLTAMTQTSHAFIKRHLVRSSFVDKARPILINNWEATYFDFTEEKILELAQTASQTGIELFVLDDGWFGRRDDDESSLGDWFVNRAKLPHGLEGLARSVNGLGMEFGLWFEPEMISIDSELYRAHPDWAIQITGRDPIYSREQLVLDLSQDQVCDYIIDSVTRILESANITYVKWDMNRNITSMPETVANGERYEFHHRYMLGLYRILETLTMRFPHILFESCSGGGGRNDLGMIYYMPQAWASDNTDAIGRLSIQEGTSLIYPVNSLGAHVSAVPNHQVGRVTPLETRGNVAMMGGAFGYELDLTSLEQEEIDEITEQVATYKSIRATVQNGQCYRLARTSNTQSTIYVNEDQSQAVFTFVKILAQPEAPLIQVRLKGLDPEAQYHCPRLKETFYGDELMNIGLTMPHVQKDYFSVQYIFNKL